MHAAKAVLTGRANMEVSEVNDGRALIRRSAFPTELDSRRDLSLFHNYRARCLNPSPRSWSRYLRFRPTMPTKN